MNTYKNDYGFHTPTLTKELAELLTKEGLVFYDSSWHNDAIDSLTIKLSDTVNMRIWVGDPHPDSDCKDNNLSLWHATDIEFDKDILTEGSFKEMIAKARELLTIQLAHNFSKFLRVELGKDIFTVIARNQSDAQSNDCCHSHDFCDANMTMLKAWETTFQKSFDLDIDDERMMTIWNKAWDLSKAAMFNPEKITI